MNLYSYICREKRFLNLSTGGMLTEISETIKNITLSWNYPAQAHFGEVMLNL